MYVCVSVREREREREMFACNLEINSKVGEINSCNTSSSSYLSFLRIRQILDGISEPNFFSFFANVKTFLINYS